MPRPVRPLAPRPSVLAAASIPRAWLEPTTTSAPAAIAAAATPKPTPDAPPITTIFAPSSFAMTRLLVGFGRDNPDGEREKGRACISEWNRRLRIGHDV